MNDTNCKVVVPGAFFKGISPEETAVREKESARQKFLPRGWHVIRERELKTLKEFHPDFLVCKNFKWVYIVLHFWKVGEDEAACCIKFDGLKDAQQMAGALNEHGAKPAY